ncbi:polygalacturonase 1 beta-like protein 1 [Macadamia integrifolia]|uniref:polygalacturonase 1 beta-like protein 1 n=1 Tax=Macadamia integrifolia TaxID=60698 RepID=UPI001C4E73EB|nr:polygalacturonase 1 beta-like protein 1 [Macadamia integrifolia]
MMHPILLLGNLIVAYFSGSRAENVFSQYWKEHIDCPHPPQWLAAKASPLSLHQAASFMKLMEENKLPSHLPSFCEQANVACSTNALIKKPMDDPYLPPVAKWPNAFKVKYDDLPKEIPPSIAIRGGLSCFHESMVQEGSYIHVPDLRDPMSYKSFMPRPLASKIPFYFAQIKELKKFFGVVDESDMDEYVKVTLRICEKSPTQGEQRSCVTSVEDLIDFVVEKLGHHLCI